MAETAGPTDHLLQRRPGAVALLAMTLATALTAGLGSSQVLAQDLLQTRPGNTASLISNNMVNAILPVEEAFALQLESVTTAEQSAGENTGESTAVGALQLRWRIAADHYLYRQSLQVLLPDGSALTNLKLPEGEAIEDEFFGEVEVYYQSLALPLPLAALANAAGTGANTKASSLELEVHFQGCAAERYCYPPHQQRVLVPLP